MTPQAEIQETRQRLMIAAAEVFAARGYRDATVREICEKAAANIAAVNYHFRDKEGLYQAILFDGMEKALVKYPPDQGTGPSSTPQERLEAFIRTFYLRILGEGKPVWHGKLMAREMTDPTPVFDRLINEMIKPRQRILRAIVKELLPPKATEMQLRHCEMSIIAQCVFHHSHRPFIDRIYADTHYNPEDIETLVRHTTRFSLAGIAAIADEINSSSSSPMCPVGRLIKSIARPRKGGKP